MTRETWTDERMDDLAKQVETGFDRVDRRFEQVDRQFERVHADIKTLQADVTGLAIRQESLVTRQELKAEIRGLRGEMAERFDKLEARADERFDAMALQFNRLEHLLLQGALGLVGGLVVGALGLIVTQL